MGSHSHPVWQLLDQLQAEVRVFDAKLTELRARVAEIELPGETKHVCTDCGAVHRHRHALEEHRYRVHDGPVPESYLAGERRAGLTA